MPRCSDAEPPPGRGRLPEPPGPRAFWLGSFDRMGALLVRGQLGAPRPGGPADGRPGT